MNSLNCEPVSERNEDAVAAYATPPGDKASHADGTNENASEKNFCWAALLLARGLVRRARSDTRSESASNDQ